MDESLMALSKRYSVPMEQLMLHKMDLLHRFHQPRPGRYPVPAWGGDPGRKLSPADRLVGAAKLAVEMGVVPAYMAVGAAAGVWRYVKEAGWEQSAESCRRVLTEVSQLPEDHTFAQLVEQFYGMILAGQGRGRPAPRCRRGPRQRSERYRLTRAACAARAPSQNRKILRRVFFFLPGTAKITEITEKSAHICLKWTHQTRPRRFACVYVENFSVF